MDIECPYEDCRMTITNVDRRAKHIQCPHCGRMVEVGGNGWGV